MFLYRCERHRCHVADLETVIKPSSELPLVCWPETRRTAPSNIRNNKNKTINPAGFYKSFDLLERRKDICNHTFFSSRISLKRMRTFKGKIKKELLTFPTKADNHETASTNVAVRSAVFPPCVESAVLNLLVTNLRTENRESIKRGIYLQIRMHEHVCAVNHHHIV